MRALSNVIILSANVCLAQTHFFTTAYAGTVPPLANPVALKQYLDYPSAVAYDPHGNLYYANYTQALQLGWHRYAYRRDNSWRNGRQQRARHRRDLF